MRMIGSATVLGLALLGMAFAMPQAAADVRDLRDHPFEATLPSGTRLTMNLRSGDVRIRGRDDDKLTVHVDSRDPNRVKEVTLRLDRSDRAVALEVFGGPQNDVHVTIEEPRASALEVRMSAGDLTVEGITGDKDVELYAGDLIIVVGDPKTYAHVDASVLAGDIDATPFGESHSGLFRSFEKTGGGTARLHARVLAGDLILR
ncbi:MAG TPA: hypothetical protein VIX35_09300 [Vicinamibacterales bacterium]